MGKRYSLLTGQEIDVPDDAEDMQDTSGDPQAEARRRIALETELGTMRVRLQAARDALLQSEMRMLALETETKTIEDRLTLSQQECARMEAQLIAFQSMRATADELLQHMSANHQSVKEAITIRAAAGAPTFDFSFVRDSAGRIKSPVTAKPRA